MPDRFAFDAVTHRPLIFDGAWDPHLPYFAELCDAWGPDWALADLPEHLVRRIHLDYASAGADVLQTFTWGMLEELALQEASVTRAARMAREVAHSMTATGRPCWVAGSVPPPASWLTNHDLKSTREQARRVSTALIAGGVDLLVLALHVSKATALAALQGAQEACSLSPTPILVSFDITPLGELVSGDDLAQTLAACETMGAHSAGVYLCTSPERLPEQLFQANGRHAFADAGYTSVQDGQWTWSMDAPTYGEYVAEQAKRLQLRFCGGGWGLTPEHIREVAKRI